MTNEERLKAAGWKLARNAKTAKSSYIWTKDGIDWYTEDEALADVDRPSIAEHLEVVCAERDAAIARAERAEADARGAWRIIGEIEAVVGIAGNVPAADTVARVRSLAARAEAAEALAASRPEITPEDVVAYTDWREGVNLSTSGPGYVRVTSALRAHAAKVSR